MTAGGAHEALEIERRYVAIEGLRIVDFEEESVVFHPLTWDAHLLNSSASAALDLFLQGPQTERQVEAFFKDALLPEEQAQARHHAQNVVDGLKMLGLVHSVDR